MRQLVPRTHVFLPDTPAMQADPTYPYQLPYLEDLEGLHIGYMQFIRGVVDKWIDARRAKLVLEALKAVGSDLRHKEKLRARAAELAARRKQPESVKAAEGKQRRKAGASS